MDTSQIKTLLEKYFEGQTERDEEQVLLDFFRGEAVPPELLPYRQQFLLLQAGREQETDGFAEFETRLAGLIDGQQQIRLPEIKSRLFFRLAVAATIAVLIGITGLLVVQNNWHNNRDTYSDPQQAYAEAQKVLLYVSGKINTGIEPLSAISKINAGNEHLKSLSKLNSGLGMLNVVSFINNSSNLKK